MFNEVIRMPAAWWQHATKGVNAKLATVPRGTDPLPPNVNFADATTDGDVARGTLPEKNRPILTTEIHSWPRMMPVPSQGVLRDFQVIILVRYGDHDAKTQEGLRDAHYVLRAVLMSLSELMKGENEASRTLNNVQLYELVDVRPATVYTRVEDRDIAGGLLLTFNGRDIQPT